MSIVKIPRTKPELPTGVTCARCGNEIKARNEKAQKAFREYKGVTVLVCASCFEEQSHG